MEQQLPSIPRKRQIPQLVQNYTVESRRPTSLCELCRSLRGFSNGLVFDAYTFFIGLFLHAAGHIQFLKENPVQYFATVGLDGRPKVRPFQFMLEDGGRLWFCTSNKKDVYAEIQKTPYTEISVSSPSFAWIRLSGRVTFEDNRDVKNRILAESGLVKSLYGSADNPDFEAFYLADAKATIADFSGQPSKTYML